MPFNPCDKCGKEVTTEFTVANDLWTEVTGNHDTDNEGFADGYWCLDCFVIAAEKLDRDFTCTIRTRKQYFDKIRCQPD